MFYQKIKLQLFLVAFSAIYFVSCKIENQSNQIQFQELEPIIEAYINQNQQFEQLTAFDSEQEYPTPSFHLYLYKWNQDTVVSIVQRPFLNEFHILGIEWSDSTILYSDITPKTFIEFNKSPIVLFDPDSLLNPSSLTTITEVPNRYKFQGENIHRKSEIWDFVLENGEFVRDDRKIHLTKPDDK